MPKINFASSMIVEDHLKKVLAKTDGKGWKFSMNKLLPRSQHSPFGDFPAEYFPAKHSGIEPVPKIDAAEVSIAAKGTRKYSSLAWAWPPCFQIRDCNAIFRNFEERWRPWWKDNFPSNPQSNPSSTETNRRCHKAQTNCPKWIQTFLRQRWPPYFHWTRPPKQNLMEGRRHATWLSPLSPNFLRRHPRETRPLPLPRRTRRFRHAREGWS